jgi:hypothetical protein
MEEMKDAADSQKFNLLARFICAKEKRYARQLSQESFDGRIEVVVAFALEENSNTSSGFDRVSITFPMIDFDLPASD